MFCIGCAGKLSTFVPSGPSALNAMKAGRLDARGRPLSRTSALPSETPMFWLRLVGFASAALLAFFAWYFLVVRSPASTAPAEGSRADVDASTIETPARKPSDTPQPAVTSAPSTPSAAADAVPVKPTTPAAPAPPPQATAKAEPQQSDATPTAAPAPAPAPKQAAATAPAAPPDPAPAAVPSTTALAPSAPSRRTLEATATAAASAKAEASRTSRSTRTERTTRGEPQQPVYEYRLPDELVSPSAAQARGPDLGPPIAPSPPPRYAYPTPVQAPQASVTPAPDLGPPIAPSPPPRYASDATSAGRSQDLGPPIVPSPGPTRARASRSDDRDPVRACANLDYLSMKSCERVQCAKAEFRSHPRCESARIDDDEREAARRALARGG
jgi:cytoskeletal protein RodZ